jgi:ABC-type bacteriocin/lantibiotic exporter with double-glycine peptidase domain
VLGYFGCHATLEELRQASGISRDGLSLNAMIALARSWGLEARAWRKPLDRLAGVALPAIAHCRFNHFVVLEQVLPGSVIVNDPVSGPRRVPMGDFSEDYTGIAITFRCLPGLTGRPAWFRPRRAVAHLLRPFRAWGLAALAVACLAWVGPVLAARGVEQAVDGGEAWRVLWLAAGASALAVWLRGWVLARLEVRLRKSGFSRMLHHIGRMPAAFFSYRFSGSICGLVDREAGLGSLLCGELGAAALWALSVPVLLAVIGAYSPAAATVCAGFLLAQVLAAAAVYARRTGAYRQWVHYRGSRPGLTGWQIRRIDRLKIGGRALEAVASIAGTQARSLGAEQSFGAAVAAERAAQNLLAALMAVAVFVIARALLNSGSIAAVELLALSASARIRAVCQQWGALWDIRSALMRRADALCVSPESPASASSRPSGTLSDAAHLRGVTFGYGRQKPPILRDIDFAVPAARVVGIAGRPGSGRSTLARLVSGLHQPWEGVVRADNPALVERWAPMFPGTVRDNVTLGDPSIDDTTVAACLRDAALEEAIAERSGGLAHAVSLGATNFSGGERQRLAIARALARHPRLLILDEATDALDPDLEARVLANLRRRGCACILISLRPSTLASCDEVIVLEDGAVVERGVPEELAAMDGAYVRLLRRDRQHA